MLTSIYNVSRILGSIPDNSFHTYVACILSFYNPKLIPIQYIRTQINWKSLPLMWERNWLGLNPWPSDIVSEVVHSTNWATNVSIDISFKIVLRCHWVSLASGGCGIELWHWLSCGIGWVWHWLSLALVGFGVSWVWCQLGLASVGFGIGLALCKKQAFSSKKCDVAHTHTHTRTVPL